MGESNLVVKSSLQRFFKNNKTIITAVQSTVTRMNKIMTEAYHLLNVHVRRLLEDNLPLPDMNSKWLRQFIYSVSTVKGKAMPPEEPLLRMTFDKFYVPLLNKVVYVRLYISKLNRITHLVREINLQIVSSMLSLKWRQ
jgi:hypothetical protein